MSFGGNDYSHSAANWIGTGSRPLTNDGNLVIGETMTGSIAEFRTWKYALTASKFKQHIYDKKSTVGNSATGSKDDLIYHYRLNENWASGSSNPKIKDYNSTNIKDYTYNQASKAIDSVSTINLKQVINGTGIILHTGMGRSPLSKELVECALNNVMEYSNLELDIQSGKRGERNIALQFCEIFL